MKFPLRVPLIYVEQRTDNALRTLHNYPTYVADSNVAALTMFMGLKLFWFQ
jgi:hypothetical protein